MNVNRSSQKRLRKPGIRALLRDYRPAVILAALVVVVGSILFVIWYQSSSGQQPTGVREFFTDDDGSTWFLDDGTKLPPFDHNGRPAVVAKVFQTRSGVKFVGFLMKFSDDAKRKIETARATGPTAGPQNVAPNTDTGILLKKPHGGTWTPDNTPAAQTIRKFTAPDGSMDYQPVPAGM